MTNLLVEFIYLLTTCRLVDKGVIDACNPIFSKVRVSTTVEPRYNEVLGTMKITLLYQVSHYIRVKKQRNIKSRDQQNYLVIRGF